MTVNTTPMPPQSVRIGHLTYAIAIDSAGLDSYSLEHGLGKRAGDSNAAKQSIRLNSEMGADYAAETLLHEILHQCFEVTATNLDRDSKAGADDIEERAVSALGGSLLAVLRDNPDVVAYLLSNHAA